MNDNPPSGSSKDRLIDLLQSDGNHSISDELLAELNDEELREFAEAQQAMKLLEMANPDRSFDLPQQAVDTATMHDALTPATRPNQINEALPGIQKLGHYEIGETLGQGGFGIVVKALDTKLGRTVALKIPNVGKLLQGDEGLDRFAREARLVAMLSHPAIVPIYETGADGPLIYIVSEYCNGGPLSRWFDSRQKKVAPTLAAKIVARLAEAVQHAHSREVIHRDLKPSNVLLEFDQSTSADDEQSVVAALRISDFGLAKFLADDQSVTQTGATIGTPAYMSPEQARGEVDGIGPAADIYAMGAILYELLTGRLPIVRESTVATMRAIETQNPIPPRKINSHVSADLSAVCMACLEKNPQDRYRSAQELQNDLNRLLEGLPVKARPATTTSRVVKWCGRNPWLAASTGLLFLALTAGMVVSTTFWLAAERANAKVLVQTRRVRQAVDELLTAIANEPSIRSKDLEQFRSVLLRSASNFYEQLSRERPTDPELQQEFVETLYRLAVIHSRLDDHSQAVVICEEALSLLDDEDRDDKTMVMKLLNQQLSSLSVLGRLDDARVRQAQAVALSREISNENPNDTDCAFQTASQLILAGSGAVFRKDFATAEGFFDEAIKLVCETTGKPPLEWESHPLLWQFLAKYADFLARTERYDEAQAYATKSLQMLGANQTNHEYDQSSFLRKVAHLHFVLGLIGSHTNKFVQSEEHWSTALEIYRILMDRHSSVGEYADRTVSTKYSFALIKMYRGKLAESEARLNENLAEIDRLLPVFPDRNRAWRIHEVNCLNLLYGVCQLQEKNDEARIALTTAVVKCQTLMEDRLDRDNYVASLLGNFYANMGFLENTQEKYDAAIESYCKSIEILEPIATEQRRGESVRWLSNAYVGRAVSHQELEDFQSALENCESFLALVPRDRIAPNVRRSRVEFLARLNRYEDSVNALNEMIDNATPKTKLFELASLAALCAGIAGDAGTLDNVATVESDRFLSISLLLLQRTISTGELGVRELRDNVNSEPNFDSVRETKSYIEFMNSLN